MIVDTSAIVAVVNEEPDAPAILETMRDAESLRMATPTALELCIVLGPERLDRTMDFLGQAGVKLVDFTHEHLIVAQQAHAAYGRRSPSKAKLNFGDCMAYALAKATGEPLLFEGDEFTHTDITAAR